MAVGISCAGTANKDALDLLSPMLMDQVDFVRQGALVSMRMSFNSMVMTSNSM